LHNKILNEFSGDKIGDFIVENDVVSIIKEGADTGRAPVDDGPGTFYKSLDQYKRETKDWVKQLQNDLGYKVIGYILSDGAMDPEEDYTMDHRDVPAISYGAKKKYKSRLRDVIENLGWRVIKWMGVDDPNVLFAGPPVASGIDAAGRMEDNIRNTSDLSKKAPKTSGGQPRLHVENLTPEWWKNNLIVEDSTNLLKDIEHSNNPLDNRILLMCGGAAGHMAHPFDDKNLTFGDLKKIIELGLGGNLDREDNVTEKLDGQNLMVSWKS